MSKNNIIEFGDEVKKLNELLQEQLKILPEIGAQIKKSYASLPSELTRQLKEQQALEIQSEKLRQESIKTIERLEALSKRQIQTARESQRLAEQNNKTEQRIANERDKRARQEQIDSERRARQQEAENKRLEAQNKRLEEANRPYNKLKLARLEASRVLQDLLATEDKNSQAVARARQEYDRLDRQFRTINESMRNYQDNVGNYGSALNTAGYNIRSLIGAFGIVGGITTGVQILKDAFNTVVEFDNGMLNVMKTTGLTRKEIQGLGQDVRALSKDLGVVSSVQLTEYMATAGQLGVKGTSNLLKFTEAMAKLEVASNIAGSDGAESVARFLTLMDKGVQNVKNFGDEVVNLGNNFPATERAILDAATSIAQGTAVYDFGRQSALAYATALSSLGVESELAGSKTAKALKEIESAVLAGGKELEQFSKLAGMTSEEFTKLFAEDKAEALRRFIGGLNQIKVSGGSVVQTLNDLGLKEERLQRVLSALASEGGYKTLNDALITVKDSTGAMSDEFDTASTKLKSQIASLSVNWDNFILAVEDGNGVLSKSFAVVVGSINNTVNMLERLALSWEELNKRASAEGFDIGEKQAEKLISSLQNDVNKREKINIAINKTVEDQVKLEKELAELREKEVKITEGSIWNTLISKGVYWYQKEIEEKEGLLGRIKAINQKLRQANSLGEGDFYSANITEYGDRRFQDTEGGTTPTKDLTKEQLRALKNAEEERLKTIAETEKVRLSMKIESEKNISLATARGEIERMAIQSKYLEDYKGIVKLNYDEEVRQANGNKEKLLLAEAKYNAELQKLADEQYKITEEAREKQYKDAVKLANMLEDNEAKNAMKSALLTAKTEQDKVQVRLKYIDKQREALERDRQDALRNVKEESLEYSIIWEEFEQKRRELDQQTNEIIADQAKKAQEKIKSYLSEFTDLGNFGFSSLNIFTTFEENGKTAFENLIDSAKNWQQKTAIIIGSVGEFFKDVMNVMQESSRARFENEMKQLELSYETNILFAGESKEAKEKLEQEFEEKQRELRIKQAKRDKQMAIMNAVINTAQGVVSMLATVPWPANFVMAGLVGALGAVQIATIASTPIPEFWTGTDNAPQGWAWTQERGAEVITDKHGNVKTMGNNKGAQLTWLESGDKVFKSQEDYFKSDMARMLNDNGISHNINIDPFDYGEFDRILAKNQSQTNVNMSFDEDGFNYRTDKRNRRQQKVSYNARG